MLFGSSAELTFPQHVHRLISPEPLPPCGVGAESQGGPHQAFNFPMILFQDIVHVPADSEYARRQQDLRMRKYQQRACESRDVSEQTLTCRHGRGTLLRQVLRSLDIIVAEKGVVQD
jgi:hypothetical protein